jgi:hypothetical protein
VLVFWNLVLYELIMHYVLLMNGIIMFSPVYVSSAFFMTLCFLAPNLRISDVMVSTPLGRLGSGTNYGNYGVRLEGMILIGKKQGEIGNEGEWAVPIRWNSLLLEVMDGCIARVGDGKR